MYKNTILCASSAYEQKYYLAPEFEALPEAIKEELKIMCILYTTDIGGILTLEFDPDGQLIFQVTADESDLLYDEIGSALKMKQIQREKEDLFESLELYYKAFIQKQDITALLKED